MEKLLNTVNQEIESLALNAVMLESTDIPGLGDALKSLESIEEMTRDIKEEPLIRIVKAVRC